MIGLVIVGVLLLLLVILLLIPARVRVSYENGAFTACARYGSFRIPLYPRPEKKAPEVPLQKEAARLESGAATAQAEQTGKKKLALNAEQIFYLLERLPPILGRALKRVGKRIRIEPLKIHLLVAGSDPADTARLYGNIQAALASGLPVLHRMVRIREQDIQLFLDFQEEELDCIADVGISMRPLDALVIGLCAGASALKCYMGFKKLADVSVAADATNKTTPVTGSGAA